MCLCLLKRLVMMHIHFLTLQRLDKAFRKRVLGWLPRSRHDFCRHQYQTGAPHRHGYNTVFPGRSDGGAGVPPSASWAIALILVVFAPPRSFFGVTLCGMCGSIQSILCNKKDFADIRPGHLCYWASLSSRCVKGKVCAGPTSKLTATLHNKTINNDKERVENEAAWV